MLQDKYRLQIPGPTPVPPRVQHKMARPMIGHRDPDVSKILQNCSRRLGPVFGTEEPVLILTASGTAALEGAVVNTVSPGDEAVVIVTGAFGDRFAKILSRYQIGIHRLEVPWGESCTPDRLAAYLQKRPQVKAVFMTYCETSTGVLNPIADLASVVKKYTNALVIVDGVSAVGGTPARMDQWEIDILVTGSQKAFMLPAGLSFAAVSQQAWSVIEENQQSRFYLDFLTYRSKMEQNTTPFTPAVSHLFGLAEVLDMLEEEGLEHVYSRHQQMMEMTRTGIRGMGLTLLTKDEDASPTVTAVQGGTDWSVEELRQELRRMGLRLAGGQQHLKGKIFRIGHMGYCDPLDILTTLSALEVGLTRIGVPVQLGTGVKAAEEVWI
ncbi:alanine--glyoxylate aminotransferase family protein [Kroppenstedtia pulmonis]|uniref:Alanine--glyoxylate aminotransferase family protein n=1 Tax=Kroppenstedtia pulmonis TaxID=1380685 RepID=A0A7D4BH77_9BACL|nr:alanine--glyoxylate aminotransferase family protein [Kroppenstedtia pulmonis]QKG84295.1 alanine--glyoxylate aminotransferase family protein [Kroppenstedtia pulmonis]